MNTTPPPTPLTPIESLLADRAWIRSVARSLVRDESRADDLEQQAWVAALERPPADPSSPRGWFATVLRRAAGRDRRSDYRRDRRERVAARPDVAPATADVVAQAEWHGRVVQAVLELDEPYRTTLLLRFFEDLPPREVAARMGVPVETVRSRAQRAVAKLRERFDVAHGGDRRAWAVPLLELATGGKDASRGGPGRVGWEDPIAGIPAGATAATATATATLLGLGARGAIGLAASLLVAGAIGALVARRAQERVGSPSGDRGTAAASVAPADSAPPLLAARPGRPPRAGAADAGAATGSRVPRLLGTVTRAIDGTPVAGAVVTALPVPVLGAPTPSAARATTDADGRYALEGLAAGEHVVWAEAPGLFTPQLAAWRDDGFNPCVVTLERDGSATRDVSLEATLPVEGRVLLPDGGPAPGARVDVRLLPIGALLLPPAVETPRWSAACDAAGAFQFDSLPAPARFSLVSRDDAHPPRRDTLVLAPQGRAPVTVRLEAAAWISVAAAEADSGAPIEGARVRAFAFGPAGYEEVDGAERATRGDGTCALGPLPVASLRLEAVAPSRAAAVEDVPASVLEGGPRPVVRLRLRRALAGDPHPTPLRPDRRRLRVVGPDGRPPAYVNFLVVSPDASGRGVALSRGRLSGEAALTLPSGVGSWIEVFGAVGRDGAPLPFGAAHAAVPADGPIEVALPRACRLTGRVLGADGPPLADALVRARPSRWPAGLPRLHEAGVGFARTAADGTFAVDGLADEPYELTVEGPEGTEAGALAAVLPGGLPLEIRLRATPEK